MHLYYLLLYVLTRLQPEAKRFSFPNHEITSRKSIVVEIIDVDKITAEWLQVKTTTTPDKNAIKDAIKKRHKGRRCCCYQPHKLED